MIPFLVFSLVVGIFWYLQMLFLWWPVLNDPEYFNRRAQDDRDHVAWAKALIIGKRPVVSW